MTRQICSIVNLFRDGQGDFSPNLLVTVAGGHRMLRWVGFDPPVSVRAWTNTGLFSVGKKHVDRLFTVVLLRM